MPVMPANFAAAADELQALLAFDSPREVIDDFIDLVGYLPITSKTHAGDISFEAQEVR